MNPDPPTSDKGNSEPERGLACSACGCRMFYTVETRKQLGSRIMRRRECRHCHKRITTYEKAFGAS